MKKLLSILSIALLLSSCSNEEVLNTSEETTEVVAIISQSAQSKGITLSKDVTRGDIYPWVSEIDMKFNQVVSGYIKEQNFVLVEQGGDANFIVKNIAIGNNEIYATTKTDSPQKFETTSSQNDIGNIGSKFDAFRGLNPYVLYESTPFTQNIKKTGSNIINLKLNTLHGRRISSIRWADNAIYKTEGYAMVSFIDVHGVESAQHKLDEADVVYNYWSDSDSLDGAEITIKAEVYSKNGTLIETFTRNIEIEASTSITCSYIISDSELFRDVRINVTFQEWVEINCEGC